MAKKPDDDVAEQLRDAMHIVWQVGYAEADILCMWDEVCRDREAQAEELRRSREGYK